MPNVHSGIDGNLSCNVRFELLIKVSKTLFLSWKNKNFKFIGIRKINLSLYDTQRPLPTLIFGHLMCNSIIVHVRTTFTQVDEFFLATIRCTYCSPVQHIVKCVF